jgi:hypothetical protein
MQTAVTTKVYTKYAATVQWLASWSIRTSSLIQASPSVVHGDALRICKWEVGLWQRSHGIPTARLSALQNCIALGRAMATGLRNTLGELRDAK